ncbi:glycosyltransferase family 2 protein [Nonlabens marinus]|uniref:Putative transferase n=1 Tax=Nonlabens marinus S1-08 TaxID=1454201 RepID=W8VXD6_9FLAO|nr:glycosyltransferase [Nonlabens marinus]BAO55742.1 putative transferase [Nonlabens marinus S1-08]
MKKISLLIATKNRKESLAYTLEKCSFLVQDPEVECIICDDGSSDGTSQFLQQHYPHITILRHETSNGIHSCRNSMFEKVSTPFAITVDDDIHFLKKIKIEEILEFFQDHQDAAVMAFRIFWGIEAPHIIEHQDVIERVRSFGAGAHAMRMSDWKKIRMLPEWFEFYGEEDLMALELFKQERYIYYYPDIGVHHRVDLKTRKLDRQDYYTRLRKGIRSGWYLYAMYYPVRKGLLKIAYSLYSKLKNFVFHGDLKMAQTLFYVIKDFTLHIFSYKNESRLTSKELKLYEKLPEAKIYWLPKDQNS